MLAGSAYEGQSAGPGAGRASPPSGRPGPGGPAPPLLGPRSGHADGPGGSGTRYLFGWGVTRRYGLMAVNPLGNRSLASSSDRAGTTITFSPSFQFTGVATL